MDDSAKEENCVVRHFVMFLCCSADEKEKESKTRYKLVVDDKFRSVIAWTLLSGVQRKCEKRRDRASECKLKQSRINWNSQAINWLCGVVSVHNAQFRVRIIRRSLGHSVHICIYSHCSLAGHFLFTQTCQSDRPEDEINSIRFSLRNAKCAHETRSTNECNEDDRL